MINARAESAATRPAFRNAFARGRCLIPASGYFEWRRRGRQRIPMLLRRRGGEPFAMAGLYERWKRSDDAVLRTCAILTTEPDAVAAGVHDRMPAILTGEACEAWLDREVTDPESLSPLLRPYPLGDLVAHPVSPRVNRGRRGRPLPHRGGGAAAAGGPRPALPGDLNAGVPGPPPRRPAGRRVRGLVPACATRVGAILGPRPVGLARLLPAPLRAGPGRVARRASPPRGSSSGPAPAPVRARPRPGP